MRCCAIKSISADVLFSDFGMTFVLFSVDSEAGISVSGCCPTLDRQDHHRGLGHASFPTSSMEGVLNIHLIYKFQIKTRVYLRKRPVPRHGPGSTPSLETRIPSHPCILKRSMHVWAGVICGPLPLKVRYSSCASRRQETAPASYPPASRDAESSSHVRLVVFVPFSPVRSCDFVKETESHCSVGLGLAWPALPVAREPKKGGKGQHGDLVSFLGISQLRPTTLTSYLLQVSSSDAGMHLSHVRIGYA